jgi:hypothetical protein
MTEQSGEGRRDFDFLAGEPDPDILAHQIENANGYELLERRRRLREELETGVHTEATHLDALLEASMNYHQWKAHHPSEYSPADRRESDGELFLKYRKILRGSYQQEKAGYCLEEAQYYRDTIAEEEKALQEKRKGMSEDDRREVIGKAKVYGANWLRTAANCLEMPEARPPGAPQP